MPKTPAQETAFLLMLEAAERLRGVPRDTQLLNRRLLQDVIWEWTAQHYDQVIAFRPATLPERLFGSERPIYGRDLVPALEALFAPKPGWLRAWPYQGKAE